MVGSYSSRKHKRKGDYKKEKEIVNPNTPKIVKKSYHVTSQTAYHVMEIALQEGITEGRVIDKIVRNYLASRGTY